MKIEDLKPGDVLLSPPTEWIGWSIVALTNGKVCHTVVYIGEKDGKLQIAHSHLAGIIYEPFDNYINGQRKCYVMRHKEQTDLHPVLKAIDTYTGTGTPYPKMNLAILGLLVIANKLLKETLRNRIFYSFATLVALKLMKEVQAWKNPNKNPMTCSQFAAQCYTEAGTSYDIKFNKLIIQFGSLSTSKNENSLLDMLPSENETNANIITNADILTIDELESNLPSEDEDKIASNFIELLQNKENKPLSMEFVSKKELGRLGTTLLTALCYLFTGKEPESKQHAIEILSENRNYFVAPDDLLLNTKNLKDCGEFDKKILK